MAESEQRRIRLDISARRLSIRRTAELIVEDFSFSANAGEIIGLVGVSGSGKSTILNAIAGLRAHLICEQLSVSMQIDEQSLSGNAINASGELMYVTADDQFVPWLSAVDNIKVAQRLNQRLVPPDRHRVSRALEKLNLQTLNANNLHHGKRPHELSFGMRRRLSLASALAYDPRVLLVDEATNGLDFASASLVLKALQDYSVETRGVLIVCSHDLELIATLSSRIYYLDRTKKRLSLVLYDAQANVVNTLRQLLTSTLADEEIVR